jgi:hypothetical protein
MDRHHPEQGPRVQIKSFGIVQTAKVIGATYLVLTALFFVPLWVIGLVVSMTTGNRGPMQIGPVEMGLFLLAPVFYGIAGFFVTAAVCLLYNLVAKWVGGIEVTVE